MWTDINISHPICCITVLLQTPASRCSDLQRLASTRRGSRGAAAHPRHAAPSCPNRSPRVAGPRQGGTLSPPVPGDPGLRSAGSSSPALLLSQRWEAGSSQPGGGFGIVQGAIKIRDCCRLQISFAAFPSARPSYLAAEFRSESAAAARRPGWIRSEVGVQTLRL